MASYDPSTHEARVVLPFETRSKEKSPTALRTISEAADILDMPQHVLRFWETKFSQIKPLKRSGGRRFYRPQDMEMLQQIKHLLYTQGYTIKGAQKAIAEFSATRHDKAPAVWEIAFPAAHGNDNADMLALDGVAPSLPSLLAPTDFSLTPSPREEDLLDEAGDASDASEDLLAELAQALAEPEPDLFAHYASPLSREGLIALRAELRATRDALASHVARMGE